MGCDILGCDILGCDVDVKTLEVCHLGEVDYLTALAWQQLRVQRMIQDPQTPDGLLVLTHPEIYTLGQGASLAHLKFDPAQDPHPLMRVQRGGEITYHGPGQWVGYPILNLCRHRRDLHWYLRQLEQILIDVIATVGVKGERIPDLTGVWVQGAKVAAVGIRVTRWVTYHGFALNVDPDLRAFERIVPCGIPDRPVGSLSQFWAGEAEELMHLLGQRIPGVLADCLGLEPKPVGIDQWLGTDLNLSKGKCHT